MKRNKQWQLIGVVFLMLIAPVTVYADTSSSTNYRVEQTFFGSGGELDAASTSYRAKQTLGEIGVGNTASTNYGAYAGFNTTDDPYIEFVTSPYAANLDLGYLSSSSARTASAPFYVRAWQASGYVVQTASDPPQNGNKTLNPLASPTVSTPGTEQFGINLAANTTASLYGAAAQQVPTSLASFGAAPQQVPDSTFSFGAAAAGYNTTNQYKYVKGDTIASSPKSTSVTIYTVSYLFNISDITAAGQFTFIHDMVATGTY